MSNTNFYHELIVQLFKIGRMPRTWLWVQSTFTTNLKALHTKIKLKVKKKVQASHPTRPTAHQLHKIKERIQEEIGQRQLLKTESNNRQDRQLLKRAAKLMTHQPGNTKCFKNVYKPFFVTWEHSTMQEVIEKSIYEM